LSNAGIAVFALLGVQILLGVGTVVRGYPLALATAHNAGAAAFVSVATLSGTSGHRMMNRATDDPAAVPESARARLRDYFELTKPKVVALLVFTAIVGMLLAAPGFPPPRVLLFGAAGIWLAAASAAAINHVLDRRIDAEMVRTRRRPIPSGHVSEVAALLFAFTLGLAAMLVLGLLVNPLTALLTFASLIGYSVIYTVWLKHATPQNIVIGGAAGAAPPVLGWTAVTNSIDPHALLLFLIIYTWTPPHFWALAIARRDDYAVSRCSRSPTASNSRACTFCSTQSCWSW
jgi:protoheme IX farnesyltransferase